MDVLEKHLNNETINQTELNTMFRDAPDLMPEIQVAGGGEVTEVTDIDQHLFNSKPKFMTFREAKPGQLFHCTCCEKSFRRSDNYRRHCASQRHLRRAEAQNIAASVEMQKKTECTTKK